MAIVTESRSALSDSSLFTLIGASWPTIFLSGGGRADGRAGGWTGGRADGNTLGRTGRRAGRRAGGRDNPAAGRRAGGRADGRADGLVHPRIFMSRTVLQGARSMKG
jgi:hypothetical protein